MQSYIEIALVNALVVIPLALIAEVVGRVFRRPALTHVLWVLVLVKLITPPLWHVPLIDREWVTSVSNQIIPKAIVDIERIELRQKFPRVGENMASPLKPKSRPRTLAAQDQRFSANQVSPISVVSKWIRSENLRQLVYAGLLILWSLGAFAWFVVQGFRCVRFRLSLSRGTSAGSELQRFADRMARRLGLSHSPTVWLMPGVLSPMLWGNGQSAILIFPEQLLDRLDAEATGTLLTHEIAHFRRRDHWVRIVALLATGFFWWHPIIWWARREIEAVEEECCDALVVKAAAAAAPPKRYAEAILDAVDFLAEHQLRLPALATGLGQVPFLRQRLTWIMRGHRRQDLGYCGRLLCLLLACSLPLQPTWLAARTPMLPTIPAVPRIETRPLETPSSNSGTVAEVNSHPSNTLQVRQPLESVRSRLKVESHSSDGRFAILGNQSTRELLDLETGKEFDLFDFGIQAMAFAMNSHQFVSVSKDNILRLWNAETCEVESAWEVPGGTLKSVDISQDAEWIVTGGKDGIVRIWSATNQRPIQELPQELAPINCVRFSPNGEILAVATGDWMSQQTGRIALMETTRWTERTSMNWNSPTAAVAFRNDGKSLMSGDWQGRIARWSIQTGELLGLSEGHKDLMAAAEFSPNGSPLADTEVSDLRPDAEWGDSVSTSSGNWFFGNWSLKTGPDSKLPPRR